MAGDSSDKNIHIGASFSATKEKRKHQECHVRTVKIQVNKLNAQQREWLKMAFVEAKWLYNHILSLAEKGQDIFGIDYKELKEVMHYDKDRNYVAATLKYLPAQARQDIVAGITASIRAMAAMKKKKGGKCGKLKYKAEYTSINLKQPGVTYKIQGRNRIRLAGCKKPFRVNGLGQLDALGEYELANAKLISKANGYYVALTCYVDKKTQEEKPKVGIDMGCKTAVVCSDGRKYDTVVEESGRLKTLQRKLARSVKGSNNGWRIRRMLRKEYERLSNRKDDAARKIAASLKQYSVVMQDELLNAWKSGGHGKKVQHSVLGRLKQLLIMQPDTVVLDRFVPTTKMCCSCGTKVQMTLRDRTFVCPCCGHTEDRDVHAARNMLWFDENIIGVGRTEFKLAEFEENVKRFFQNAKQEAANSSD